MASAIYYANNRDIKNLTNLELIISRHAKNNSDLKQRLSDLVDVTISSHNYWITEFQPPEEFEPIQPMSAKYMSIICSDAMYFWMGDISSGLNPIVAG